MGKYLDLARQIPLHREKPTIHRSEHESIEAETPAGPQEDADELFESMRRLEALGICIAVWEDGSMRVLVTEEDTIRAIGDGGTIYSPADMWHFVRLEPNERRMLHRFKKQFGGSIEWRDEDRKENGGTVLPFRKHQEE